MARNQRTYDNEYKAQAVKLAQEIGGDKAAKELGIPNGTIYCWIKAFKEGALVPLWPHILLIMRYPLMTNLLNLESVLRSRIRKFAV